MKMSVDDGINMIITAYKERMKDDLYLQYINERPYMDEDNYMSFDDYYKNYTTRVTINKKDKKDIYKDVNNILGKFLKSGK